MGSKLAEMIAEAWEAEDCCIEATISAQGFEVRVRLDILKAINPSGKVLYEKIEIPFEIAGER